MKKAPGVIFKTLNFNQPIDPVTKEVRNKSKKSRDNYYKSGDYLNYISRPDAVFNLNIDDEQVKLLNTLRTGSREEKVKYNKMLEEINKNFKSTGIYSKNGLMSIEEVKELRKDMKNLDDNQVFWDTIVSFSDDFIKENNLYTPEKVQKALNTELKNFFSDNGMDYEKVNWFFSMHTNTDNNHIHLGFFEKEPTSYEYVLDNNKNKVLNKYGKPKRKRVWKQNGKLYSKIEFRAGLDMNIRNQQKDNSRFLETQRNLRERFEISWEQFSNNVNTSWKDAKQIYVDINKSKVNLIDKIELFSNQLQQKLKLNFGSFKDIPLKKITYGSKFISDLDRKKLDEITLDFIKSDVNLKKEYDIFVEENNKKAEEFCQIYSSYELENVDLKIEEKSFILTTQDLLKDEKDWNLEDPIEKIKYKKLKYRNEHIKSLNAQGYFQGILPAFGNKVLKKIIWNWKKEKYKSKRSYVGSNLFNPNGISNNKKYFSSLLYMPKNLFQMIQKEKRKARQSAMNIIKNEAKEKNKLIKERRNYNGIDY
ncbi:relaxase MobL [Spiroplasma floricola]|uniref:Relaxase n=1 Tax=Spiroplasma floricola 23-6 TaxID=1336749 RepID=A0A2K8SFJ1_9MOLU|nr:relaxase MobL [Spiroplasma floricola]AUB32018.1 hypothetical protein SFLOR_v1c09700 [Spiroplasma floricola 23-6]